MKKFLISIDTEGDNLWNWKPNDKITTNNARYLSRFQDLCDEYGFKPTYLTNYEMALDDCFQGFCKRVVKNSSAEIGLHVHAWNNPPEYCLKEVYNNPGAAYITEYPYEIMLQKAKVTYDLLSQITGMPIVTHRSGRWATNDQYFRVLGEIGIKYDCSITPHIDWSGNPGMSIGSCGNDYSNQSEKPHLIDNIETEIWEIPVTVRQVRKFFSPSKVSCRSIIGSLYRAFSIQNIWLRPTNKNSYEMKWLIDDVVKDSNADYIMFMLHSSELMPGGSPTFLDDESIEELYKQLRELFTYASKNFEGMTIGAYGEKVRFGK